MLADRLQQRDGRFPFYSGEADVCSTGWNQGGVQPDDKMVNVLALSLDDCLRIRRGKWVTSDRHVVLNMCHQVYENLLSLRQTENDCVILR